MAARTMGRCRKALLKRQDGDGLRERVGWAAAQDAFLVLDLNADGTRGAGYGRIDQAKELVLSLFTLKVKREPPKEIMLTGG
jgi:hypothetical protein